MDPNSQAYYKSALQLGLPVKEFEAVGGFSLILGKNHYYIFDKNVPWNNASSQLVAGDKFAANMIMAQANIPVPKTRRITTRDFTYEKLNNCIAGLKFPLVVKPMLFGAFGLDVVCNVPNIHLLFNETEKLLPLYPFLIFEEYHGNLQDYRVLVFNGTILDVMQRDPAAVVGDGISTIQELADIENAKREKTNNILWPIKFDFEAGICLKELNLTKESILESGKRINLGYTCNTSRGGTVTAIPNRMCKENKKLFLKVARVLNLNLVGIDVKCKSLDEPMTRTGGIIIEANHSPSIRIHEEGVSGTKKQVTKPIMKAFIYKHPISYFFHVLTNRKILKNIMINMAIVLIVLAFAYVLLLTDLVSSK